MVALTSPAVTIISRKRCWVYSLLPVFLEEVGVAYTDGGAYFFVGGKGWRVLLVYEGEGVAETCGAGNAYGFWRDLGNRLI